jgi:hypothetical protein
MLSQGLILVNPNYRIYHEHYYQLLDDWINLLGHAGIDANVQLGNKNGATFSLAI